MSLDINITLVIVIIFGIYMVTRGYRKGMTKELSGLIALAAAFIVLALGIMLKSSYQQGEVTNTVYSVIFLVVFGAVYGIVRFVLKSVKLISKLPILSFLDSLLGTVVGLAQAILLVWVFFLLCENGYMGNVAEYVCRDIDESAILTLIQQYNFFVQ